MRDRITPDAFTISPAPVWPRASAHVAPWMHAVDIHDGRTATGTALVGIYAADLERSARDAVIGVRVTVELSPTLEDDDGRTVYRDADPDADEVQRYSTVVVKPYRVNGVPYRARIILDASVDESGALVVRGPAGSANGTPWHVHGAADLERLTGEARPSAAAQSHAWRLALALADAVATPDTVRAALVAYYAGQVERAERARDDADRELNRARQAHADAVVRFGK